MTAVGTILKRTSSGICRNYILRGHIVAAVGTTFEKTSSGICRNYFSENIQWQLYELPSEDIQWQLQKLHSEDIQWQLQELPQRGHLLASVGTTFERTSSRSSMNYLQRTSTGRCRNYIQRTSSGSCRTYMRTSSGSCRNYLREGIQGQELRGTQGSLLTPYCPHLCIITINLHRSTELSTQVAGDPVCT